MNRLIVVKDDFDGEIIMTVENKSTKSNEEIKDLIFDYKMDWVEKEIDYSLCEYIPERLENDDIEFALRNIYDIIEVMWV